MQIKPLSTQSRLLDPEWHMHQVYTTLPTANPHVLADLSERFPIGGTENSHANFKYSRTSIDVPRRFRQYPLATRSGTHLPLQINPGPDLKALISYIDFHHRYTILHIQDSDANSAVTLTQPPFGFPNSFPSSTAHLIVTQTSTPISISGDSNQHEFLQSSNYH